MPRWLRNWLRGSLVIWLGVIFAALVFSSFIGLPHVLTGKAGTSWYGSPVWTHCRYFGPLGTVEALRGHDVHEDCPAVALLKWNGRP